jgi:hypothetical protein
MCPFFRPFYNGQRVVIAFSQKAKAAKAVNTNILAVFAKLTNGHLRFSGSAHSAPQLSEQVSH